MQKISCLKKYIIFILGLLLVQSQGFCVDIESIDSEINSKYNAQELEFTLPKLPVGADYTDDGVRPKSNNPSKIDTTPMSVKVPSITSGKIDTSVAIKLPKGTKFPVKSNSWASDSAKNNQPVNFSTTKPVTCRYITIPAGATIRGRIVDSHSPQISGNGGLVKIELESISINGATRYADGKVIKANGRKIFLNNIKGERKYLSTTGKNISKSNKFFKTAMKKTKEFSNDGLTMILAPFTFVGGVVGYAGGVVVAPIRALGAKGARISLPPNTTYVLKLTKDLYIYE